MKFSKSDTLLLYIGLIRNSLYHQKCRVTLAFIPILFLTFGLNSGRVNAAVVIEEVIVTAQKREQASMDVGISLTAFDGDRIENLGWQDNLDIALQTPGLTSPSLTGGNGTTLFSIRGVNQNDFAAHQESPIAVYVDGAYLAGLKSQFEMFDIERVEVLRGPQGTLFGRNTTGGLLHYISRRPESEFGGYGTLRIGNYDLTSFQGAVNVPLSDRLGARFSLQTRFRDGYVENRIGPDEHEVNAYAGRAQFLFRPTDDIELWLKVYGAKNDDETTGSSVHLPSGQDADGLGFILRPDENFWGTCPGCDFLGYRDADEDSYKESWDSEGNFDQEVIGVTFQADWDVNDVISAVSITDYRSAESHAYGGDIDGTPFPSVVSFVDTDLTQASQELRLHGKFDKTNWLIGFYYLYFNGNYAPGLRTPLFEGTFFEFTEDNTTGVDKDTWALFANIEYDLSEQWRIIAGLRHTDEEVEHMFIGRDAIFGTNEFSTRTVGSQAIANDESLSAKLQLEWRPNDDWMIYLGYNRGTKGPTFNAPLISPLFFLGNLNFRVDGETIDSLEGGFKATLMDGRAQLSASAYTYFDYKDYQAFDFSGISAHIYNADADISGVEVELFTKIGDNTELNLGMAYLDATAPDIPLPSGRLIEADLPQAPELSLNGMARHEWPMFNGTMSIQASFTYLSSQFFSISNAPAVKEDGYIIGNARLGFVNSSKKYRVSVYVRNIADQFYNRNLADASFLGFTQGIPGDPRVFGGEISYYW